jgi:enoyl-CoA hydratase/carnithine racemase
MLLTNRWLTSEEAHRIGLVNRVVSRDNLLDTAEEMARKIASFDPLVVRSAKQAVVRGMDMSLSDGLNLERLLASRLKRRV